MTQAKAAEVAAALVNAGYYPIVTLLNSGEYQVTANAASPAAGIELGLGKNFADGYQITGTSPIMNFA